MWIHAFRTGHGEHSALSWQKSNSACQGFLGNTKVNCATKTFSQKCFNKFNGLKDRSLGSQPSLIKNNSSAISPQRWSHTKQRPDTFLCIERSPPPVHKAEKRKTSPQFSCFNKARDTPWHLPGWTAAVPNCSLVVSGMCPPLAHTGSLQS